MESRKMVLKNLFKGSSGETDRTDLWTCGEGRRVGCKERVTWKLTLPFVK